MRLPRKRKKHVKKIVAAKTVFKIVSSGMVSAMALAQTAVIASTPVQYIGPVGVAYKAVSVAKVMADTAKSINKIMSELPNSWKHFLKVS